MSKESRIDEAYEPPWGADGWPRPTEHGLDESDLALIRSMLELTPAERLRTLENFVNGLQGAKRVGRVQPD